MIQTPIPAPSPPVPGSFDHAELENLRRIARLTPMQRIALLCSMGAVARHLKLTQTVAKRKPR